MDKETLMRELKECCETCSMLFNMVEDIDRCCEDDDHYGDYSYYEEDAIVFYAKPCQSSELMTEDDAINSILIDGHSASIERRYFMDDMFVAYPTDAKIENPDGSIVIAGPVYFIHDDCVHAPLDLSAVEFFKVAEYLGAHTVRSKAGKETIVGFKFEKEE